MITTNNIPNYTRFCSKTLFLLLFLMFSTFAWSQRKISDVRVTVKDVCIEKDSVRAILDIEIIGMVVSPREQVYLFPVIKKDLVERPMPPVVINGRVQQKVEDRERFLSGDKSSEYVSFRYREKLFHKRVSYNAAIPLEDWMKSAQVGIVQEVRNCRCEFHRISFETIADHIRGPVKPVRLAYTLPVRVPVPPREDIKKRSDIGEAQIIYKVGSANINPLLGNNSFELDKIRESINNIRNLSGVTINSIEIASYASPEGNWYNNYALSERRAASLTTWIRNHYDIGGVQLISRGYGEDWDKLVEYIKDEPIFTSSTKEELIAVIQQAADVDVRKRLLMRYNGGGAYRYLLTHIYPRLRRSVYKIQFTIPEYTIEKIKEVYDTHPEMLSLYEFYLLANEYEPDSHKFKDVMIKATQLYPDDIYSRLFKVVLGFQSGDSVEVRTNLKGLENEPVAWLYFSALYAKEHDLLKAEEYALKAERAGISGADKFLQLIGKYKVAEEEYQKQLREFQ